MPYIVTFKEVTHYWELGQVFQFRAAGQLWANCVVSSHAKEWKLLELFFEGDGNLPSQINNFLKLSNWMVMTRDPPVFIFPSSVVGGSTQECTAILPALMWTELNSQENRCTNVGAHKCKPQFKNVSLVAWRKKK